MLNISIFRESPAFYPCDLKLLNDVFDEICREEGLRADSEEAEHIAGDLIRNFEHGITEPGMLKIAVRSRRAAWQQG